MAKKRPPPSPARIGARRQGRAGPAGGEQPAAKALTHLKAHQKQCVVGWHHKPYLDDPADFQSGRTRVELARKQNGQLIKIPALKRDPPVFELSQVIGSQAVDQIQSNGQIVFHAVGDTGAGKHSDLGEVVNAMAMDFHRPNPADRPAFFFHLGDVCYNDRYGVPESKQGMYQPQFYSPYADYPGKIVAIPGNHDSNPQEDPNSIEAFEANFCAPLPATQQDLDELTNAPTRQPMYQFGVYFLLDAPYVQILGLFSNGGEYEGVIGGEGVGNQQISFLVEQLSAIKAARDNGQTKALVVAVHHPPFSGGGGHSGSRHMLDDLDSAFRQGGVAPDAVLTGHSHNYQRFIRDVSFNGRSMQVPYVVAGNGGHNITPLKRSQHRKHVKTPLRGAPDASGRSDHSLQQYFNGFGHLIVTVTARVLTIDLIGTKTNSDSPVDSVTVDLASSRITHQTAPLEHPVEGEK